MEQGKENPGGGSVGQTFRTAVRVRPLLGAAGESVARVVDGKTIELVDPATRQLFDVGQQELYGSRGFSFDFVFDAETSGGLLIAVPSQQAQQLSDRLRDAGVPSSAIAGHFVKSSADAPLLKLR